MGTSDRQHSLELWPKTEHVKPAGNELSIWPRLLKEKTYFRVTRLGDTKLHILISYQTAVVLLFQFDLHTFKQFLEEVNHPNRHWYKQVAGNMANHVQIIIYTSAPPCRRAIVKKSTLWMCQVGEMCCGGNRDGVEGSLRHLWLWAPWTLGGHQHHRGVGLRRVVRLH